MVSNFNKKLKEECIKVKQLGAKYIDVCRDNSGKLDFKIVNGEKRTSMCYRIITNKC